MNDNFKKIIDENLSKLLNKEIEYIELPLVAPNDIVEFLKEKYDYKQEYIDSNGWDHDFWITFIKKDSVKLCLSGSWYYGNEMILNINE